MYKLCTLKCERLSREVIEKAEVFRKKIQRLDDIHVGFNSSFQGTDGKVIPLSAATLQKLIEAGAIKPGTQIATPDFSPDM